MAVVWIREQALDTLLQEHACYDPLETGGILIGYWGAADEALITAVVGPGPNAVHAEDSFVPDHAYHELQVAELYDISGRTEVYLGDWHSHPGSSAYLSYRDRKTLRRIAAEPEARAPRPLMAILGQNPYELKIWRFHPGLLWF